jgi:hypothetical protein
MREHKRIALPGGATAGCPYSGSATHGGATAGRVAFLLRLQTPRLSTLDSWSPDSSSPNHQRDRSGPVRGIDDKLVGTGGHVLVE